MIDDDRAMTMATPTRLDQLLNMPAVQQGMASVAGRYLPHLLAYRYIEPHWWGDFEEALIHLSLAQLLTTHRSWKIASDARAPVLEAAVAFGEDLAVGRLPMVALRPTAAPTGRVEFQAWTRMHYLTGFDELPAKLMHTTRHMRCTIGEVMVAATPVALDISDWLTALAEQPIPVPAPSQRPPPPPELATFVTRLRQQRDALPVRYAVHPWLFISGRTDPIGFRAHAKMSQQVVTGAPSEVGLVLSYEGPKHNRDGMAAALIDSTIEQLLDPSPAMTAAILAATQPKWTRLARAIENIAAAQATKAASSRIVFRVVEENDEIALEVLLQKAKSATKTGALSFTPGSKLRLADLHDADDGHARELYRTLTQRRRFSRNDTRVVLTAELLLSLPSIPLSIGKEGKAVTLHIAPMELRAVADGDGVRIEPDLRSWPSEVSNRHLRALDGSGGLVRLDGHTLHVLTVSETQQSLLAAAREAGVVPAEGREALLRIIGTAGLPIRIDDSLLGREVPCLPSLVVQLKPHGDGLSASIFVRPLTHGANHRPGQGPIEVISSDDQGAIYCRRDVADEVQRAQQLLTAIAPHHPSDVLQLVLEDPEDALHMLTTLHVQQDQGTVRIEWPQSTAWQVSAMPAASMKIEVGSSPLGLHLEGDVEVDGITLSLARLLDAARQGKRFIALSDHRYAEMTVELRDRARMLFESSQVHGKKQMGGAAMAIALEALQKAGVDVRGREVWAEWQGRLAAAAAVDDVPSPLLKADMRPYQREGLQFFRRLQALGTGGVLADDMGLGKTIQAIAMLLDRQSSGPALVVAPTSVCINWGRELTRFAPNLRVVMLHEVIQRDALINGAGAGDIIVASYGMLTRSPALLGRRFGTVVFDEAQAIKNSDAQRTYAAREVKADFRVVLTGTPMENHLGELWSVFSVASPGLLPSPESFRSRFQAPIERDKNRDAARTLQQLVRPFMLRRTKAAVAPELPPRTEVTHRIAQTQAEAARYQALRQLLIEQVSASNLEDSQRRMMVLSAITRLRQMACHPGLDEVGRDLASAPSSKLVALQRMVTDLKAGGHRVLVFSQFTRLLDLVEPVLRNDAVSFVRLDGSTSTKARAVAVDSFQAGHADVFLISLKAGGFGLNLTAATYVIHLDPWWNPAVEAQATDRAHRIGQTRAVTVYRLVAAGTIEETVLEMQESKRALIASVLEDGDTSSMVKLSTHDLEDLLTQAADAVGA